MCRKTVVYRRTSIITYSFIYNFNLQWLIFYFWDSYYIFSYQQAFFIGTYHLLVGEGNGNPLHHSCLEDSCIEEPGRLQSMGSHSVGHDWSNLAPLTSIQRMGTGRIQSTNTKILPILTPKMSPLAVNSLRLSYIPFLDSLLKYKFIHWGKYH